MLTELYVKLEYNISEGFPESAIDLVTKLLVRCLCQLTPSFLFLLPPPPNSPHMHHLFFAVCCSSPSFPFLILITYTFPSPVLFIYLSSSSPLPLSLPSSLLFFSLTSSYNLIGASLSEPHTSVIALLCVCLLACGHIP